MEHNFKYLKEEGDKVCSGEPMRPKELEAIMERYEGACGDMKLEIEGFLSSFGTTCKTIARISYGIKI